MPANPVGPAFPSASGPSFLPFLRRSASSEDPRDITSKEAALPGLPAIAAPHPSPDSKSSLHSGFGRLPSQRLAALEEAGLRERLLQDQPIERFSRPDRLTDWSKAGAGGKRVPVQPPARPPWVQHQPVGAGRPWLREGGGGCCPFRPGAALRDPPLTAQLQETRGGWGLGPTLFPPSLLKICPLIHTHATSSPCPPTSTLCPLCRPSFLYNNPFRIKGSASPTPPPTPNDSVLRLTQPLGVRG